MKKVLAFFGAFVLSVIGSYLMWLLVYYLTPWMMSFGWFQLIICFFVETFIIGIASGVVNILCMPTIMCIKVCPASKWVAILPMLFHGYSTAMLPWHIEGDFSIVQYIVAVNISIWAVIMFGGISYAMLSYKASDND